MLPTEERPKLIVICGPTATGKTSAAIEIAREFNGEVIGADSMQIYKYMEIGTAKPTPEERAAAPHHLIDFVAPDEPFDAARYVELADKKIAELTATGRVPIVAGGTGLYIKALIHGIFESPAVDPAVRERLRAEADNLGPQTLHERLRDRDPESAGRLHPNDTYRILRALEVFESTGKPLAEHHSEHQFAEERYRAFHIGLFMERKALYDRINRRADAMIDAGLEAEVRSLLDRGYSPDLKAMQSIGYRHMADLIAGRIDRDEMVRTLKRDTRRYAKRQYTWFNAAPDIRWTSPAEVRERFAEMKKFLRDQADGC